MTTHEHEVLTPVDVALPDRTLNPAARGWSRTPLQTVALGGRWGRRKRWDYWAVLAPEFVVSGVIADVDFLGLSDVWWCDLTTDRTGGAGVVLPGARGVDLPPRFGAQPTRVHHRAYDCTLATDPDGTFRVAATWRERTDEPGALEVAMALPVGHESLNVVIPWSDRTFQYTSKHQARPSTVTLRVGDRQWAIDASAPTGGDEAWGVLDIGRGRWPYATRWNWGGGAGRANDGTVVGLQFGAKWTEGTGHTENGVIVDGRLSKIGRELEWTYDWDEPLAPWRVSDPGGQLDVTLTPRHDKHTNVNALVLRQQVHQVFGRWSGWVVDDDGRRCEFDGLVGFAEECRARW